MGDRLPRPRRTQGGPCLWLRHHTIVAGAMPNSAATSSVVRSRRRSPRSMIWASDEASEVLLIDDGAGWPFSPDRILDDVLRRLLILNLKKRAATLSPKGRYMSSPISDS